MKQLQVDGIVIKRRNFGEADRILTLFTKKFGKISVKATGVRKITSRRSSHIELLNYSQFSLYHGRSLPIVTEVTTKNDHAGLKADLTKIGFAYHICELIDGLCADNQENFRVFSLLTTTLERLCKENDIVSIIHEFEIELLTRLGFYRQNESQSFNTTAYIEQILERKLKTRKMLHRF